jgi:urea carboxylase system permease
MRLESSASDEQIRIDSEQLASFGYTQELRRTLSVLSNFAVAFSYLSVSTGIFALFALGLAFGGPAFIWSWPLVMLGQFFVALNFAEMASHFPIAGSIYQWTRQLSSRTYSWFTGWIYLFAGILTITSVAFTLTIPLENLFGWQATTATNVKITVVALIVSTIINVAGIRLLSIINNIGVAAEILGMAVFAVILLIVAHHQPLSVITNHDGIGNGSSHGYAGAFMTAMFMSLFVVYGFDTAGTLAEETKDPTRQVPKAILGALGVSFVIGAIFLVAVVVAIPNVGKAMASASPLTDTINAGLPEFWAKTYLAIVAIAIFVCTLAIQAATIRLTFGMARDKQLPVSGLLSKVHPSFGTPAYAGVVIGVLAGIPLFFSQQLPAIVTGATGLIYLSYLLCNVALFRARLGGWPKRKAPFSLGGYGMIANVLAIAWGGSMLVNFAWLRAATNPPIGLGPSWLSDKAIFELLVAVIVVVGAIYYTLFVRPAEAVLVPGDLQPAQAG